MAVRASVDRGADGRWLFEGDTSRVPGDGGAGGGAGEGCVKDLRWSDELGGIEARIAGEWLLKVPFTAFGD